MDVVLLRTNNIIVRSGCHCKLAIAAGAEQRALVNSNVTLTALLLLQVLKRRCESIFHLSATLGNNDGITEKRRCRRRKAS